MRLLLYIAVIFASKHSSNGQFVDDAILDKIGNSIRPQLQKIEDNNLVNTPSGHQKEIVSRTTLVYLTRLRPMCSNYKILKCNLVDRCPSKKIKFEFITRNVPTGIEINDDIDEMRKAPFKNQTGIIMFLCGILCTKESYATMDFLRPYFKAGDYLLIFPEYQDVMQLNNCYQKNSMMVGQCVAHMLKTVYQAFPQLSEKNTHLIGLSMGATMAGIVGHYFSESKLMRVTGLDPANPLANEHPPDRTKDLLDRTSADFVDVWHTSMGLLGTWSHLGHVNIYFNDGIHQNHCADVICSHTSSYVYFLESVDTNLGFYGRPCFPDMEKYIINQTTAACTDCTQFEVMIGFHMSHKLRGNYHVETDMRKPYAKGPTKRRPSRI